MSVTPIFSASDSWVYSFSFANLGDQGTEGPFLMEGFSFEWLVCFGLIVHLSPGFSTEKRFLLLDHRLRASRAAMNCFGMVPLWTDTTAMKSCKAVRKFHVASEIWNWKHGMESSGRCNPASCHLLFWRREQARHLSACSRLAFGWKWQLFQSSSDGI